MTKFRALSQIHNGRRSSFIRVIRGRSVVLFPVVFLSFSLSAPGADKPVSFYKDITPIFKRSCTGCHHPGKLKGELDLTTYAAFKKGGKHGAAFKPNDPKDSVIID